MEMSLEERLVLCVLRYADQITLSASAVRCRTELNSRTVEVLLGRLIERGLCKSRSIEGEARYWAVPLSETAILSYPREWLAAYCSRPIEVEEGDYKAVSYEMCGIVILVAIVTGSRETAVIADLTKLPVNFVGLVMELCHQLHLWRSPGFFELERTIRGHRDDAEEVSGALQSVIDEFCMSWTSEAVEAVLHSSRQHMTYGGVRDAWVSVEDRQQLEKAPKRLQLVKR